MSQSLKDIMDARSSNEPPEITTIKQFIHDKFKADCVVKVQQQQIIIQVSSSALAGALRPHLGVLKENCQTEKRLMIRIS